MVKNIKIGILLILQLSLLSAQVQTNPIAAAIHDIQGPGDTSPLVGKLVVTSGIVTAAAATGFWIQAPESEYGSDPNTSEGIFVFTQALPPPEALTGNLLRVTATVTEFAPPDDPTSPALTQLTAPKIELISMANALPAPVKLTSQSAREPLEGMRVSVDWLTAVGPTAGIVLADGSASSDGVFHGVMPGTPRPVRGPGLRVADPVFPNAPVFDGNPERLRVESRTQFGAIAVDLTTGTTLRNLTGVLGYAARTYTLFLDPVPRPDFSGGMGARPLLKPAAVEFTIASMNLQQFAGPRASQTRIAKVQSTIRDILQSPDIIGVQEAGDLQTLDAIGGPAGYTAYLLPGNDPNGLNVGFLVKKGRVAGASVFQQHKEVTYTNPITGKQAILFDYPPLFLDASIDGFPITVVVNQLLSLRDQPDANLRAKRKTQADFVGGFFQIKKDWNLVQIGDFNAYPFSDGYVDVIGAIQGNPPQAEVLDASLPPDQGYSYLYNGNAESIDHIVANPAARARWTRISYAHVNADFAETYRNDPARPERFSDHDIPVAYFSTQPVILAAPAVTNAATFLTGPASPNEIVTLFAAGINAGTKVFFEGLPQNTFNATSSQISFSVPDWVAGRASTEMTVQFGAGLTSTITLEVTDTSLGIFTLNAAGQGAVLNQDSTVNGPSNPAPKGSVVMVYATGAGAARPGYGAPSIVATIGGRQAGILYSGQAPGLVNGALQVNVKIPGSAPSGSAVPLIFSSGLSSSARSVTIAIR